MNRQLKQFGDRMLDNFLSGYFLNYPLPLNPTRWQRDIHLIFSFTNCIIIIFVIFLQLFGIMGHHFSYCALCMKIILNLPTCATIFNHNLRMPDNIINTYLKILVLVDATLLFVSLYILTPFMFYNVFFQSVTIQTATNLSLFIKSCMLFGFLTNLQTFLVIGFLITGSIFSALLVCTIILESQLLIGGLILSYLCDFNRKMLESKVKSVFKQIFGLLFKPFYELVFAFVKETNTNDGNQIFNHSQMIAFEQWVFGENTRYTRALLQSSLRTPSVDSRDSQEVPFNVINTQVLLDHINNLPIHQHTENFMCAICHGEHIYPFNDVHDVVDNRSINSDLTGDIEHDLIITDSSNIQSITQSSVQNTECIQLRCNHIFHKNCIIRSITSYIYTCPICRSNIGSN
jgi:hypothetical protein